MAPKPKKVIKKTTTPSATVKAQQVALNKKGANLKVDGISGPLTQAAEAKYSNKTLTTSDLNKSIKSGGLTLNSSPSTGLVGSDGKPVTVPKMGTRGGTTQSSLDQAIKSGGLKLSSSPSTGLVDYNGNPVAVPKVSNLGSTNINQAVKSGGLSLSKGGSSSQPTADTFVSNGVTYDSTGKAVSQPKLKSDAQSTLLKQGASGANISTVQTQLKNLGYNLTVDGDFGPQTKSQIMAFQQANGLAVDGIVGPQTLAALQSASTSGNITTAGAKTTESTYTAPTSPSPTHTNLGVTPLTPQDEKFSLTNDLNAEAEKTALTLAETNANADILTSASDKMLEALADIAENRPERVSLEEKLADKRRDLAIDPLESRLAGLDAQSAKLDNERDTLFANEDNRQVSVLQINRRKSQEQIQYEDAKRQIIAERNSVANELKNKYDVLDTYMKYAGQDYDNAVQSYNTQFTQAISMINLLKSVEEDKKSDAEKKKDKANASLKLMRDTLAGRSFSSLDAGTQASINKMDLEGGNPLGFSRFLMDNNIAGDRGSEFTDANGNRVVPIYSVDSKTGLMTARIITLGKTNDGSDKKTETNQKNDIENAVAQLQTIVKNNKWYGVSPDDYQTFADYLQKTYGTKAVKDLKTAMDAVGIKVDAVGDGEGAN